MSEPEINVLLESNWAEGSLVTDVRRGLGARPLTLPPRWLYDDRGSQLFDHEPVASDLCLRPELVFERAIADEDQAQLRIGFDKPR